MSNHKDLYDLIDPNRFPNLKQMLKGLRNYQVNSFHNVVPYNRLSRLLILPVSYVLVKLMNHNLFKSEYDQRKRPNPFMPRWIYKIRRKHYVYWEISRLSRGLPKAFTYSRWDQKARMMYHVDLDGQM